MAEALPKSRCTNYGKSVCEWVCTMSHAIIQQELANFILTQDRWTHDD